MEDNTSNTNRQEEGSTGPTVALIVILAVIVLGGLYFWGQRTSNNVTDIYGNPISTSTPTVDTSTTIENQSSTDDSASIEADLKSTNLDNIDSQLNVQ